MALVSMQNVSLSFTGTKILEDLNVQIEKGQRICLLGRNGVGKTTLMRTLAGELKPDSGSVQVGQGVKVAYFSQSIPQNLAKKAYDIVAEGLGNKGKLAIEYHKAEKSLEVEYSLEKNNRLEECRALLDKNDAWKDSLPDHKKYALKQSGRNYITLKNGSCYIYKTIHFNKTCIIF